jgi:hypothetical protein
VDRPTDVRGILMGMTKRAATRRYLPASPFKAPVTPPVEQYAVGDRVTHDAYGLGRVIGVDGEIAVLVRFGARQERITSPYTRMSKL